MSDAFKKIDSIFGELTQSSSLTQDRVWGLYQKHRGRSPTALNTWNLYQGYWARHENEERQRLQDGQGDPDGCDENYADQSSTSSSGHGTIKRCYEKFKTAYPATYSEILQKDLEVVDLEGPPKTMAARQRDFEKMCARWQIEADRACSINQFECAILLAGGIVNSDIGLGKIITTDGASQFFPRVMNMDQDETLGHFKSTIYHAISTATLEQRAVRVQDHAPEAQDVKSLLLHLFNTARPRAIASRSLPWTKMANTLHASGLVLVNYPEDVARPGSGAGKGISSLRMCEMRSLLFSMTRPEEDLRLRFESRKNRGDTAVIKCIAPRPTSSSHFGWVMHASGKITWNGAARRTGPSNEEEEKYWKDVQGNQGDSVNDRRSEADDGTYKIGLRTSSRRPGSRARSVGSREDSPDQSLTLEEDQTMLVEPSLPPPQPLAGHTSRTNDQAFRRLSPADNPPSMRLVSGESLIRHRPQTTSQVEDIASSDDMDSLPNHRPAKRVRWDNPVKHELDVVSGW
ncbi:hypothetical protein BV25DRAFT_1918912 [Artomyces pyxidatus]|uniref:Uncharacterized protein n=1 Tax=Artomyces pyxidatus TaxID=48021 RepID=A0ACB8SSC7_9AGAM|nr:hypothetical protein BV25DRAFT_1918912 [Artomyces pyxidatus]